MTTTTTTTVKKEEEGGGGAAAAPPATVVTATAPMVPIKPKLEQQPEVVPQKPAIVQEPSLTSTTSVVQGGWARSSRSPPAGAQPEVCNASGFNLSSSAPVEPPAQSIRIVGAEEEYVANHKDTIHAIVYNRKGTILATASEDTSIKILDCEKMRLGGNSHRLDRGLSNIKPVVRTFYDHEGGIYDVDFHPNDKLLVSAGADHKIYFWDMERQYKRSAGEISETMPVRTVNIHPSGEYVLSAGDADYVRLYSIETGQGYISQDTNQHQMPTNQVRWASEGNIFVSSSKDGSVKIWDGTNMRCVNTIRNAHGGREVVNVQFSQNTKYLVSTGGDGKIAMWDMSTGREVMRYKFSGEPTRGGPDRNRAIACFAYNDQILMGARQGDDTIYAFEAASGKILYTKLTGHCLGPRTIAASRSGVGFCVGGTDNRVRYFLCMTESGAPKDVVKN